MTPARTLACLLLAFIGAMQLLRFLLGWPITVAGFAIPAWPSAAAAVVCIGMAWMLWREGRTGR